MIEKILVAVEYGDTGYAVFNQAIELAQPLKAELNLLNALTDVGNSITFSPYSDRDLATFKEQYQESKTVRHRLLESLAGKANEVGIKAEFQQETGSPGPIICNQANEWGADLIVIGSRGRKGLSEMLLGSVSNYVVHHAACSVMIVHQSD
jgi:nucleotide-binding universal stress UspA family protein